MASTPALAQVLPGATPQTREEAIAAERADKVAELWPERQSGMVNLANGFAERGLKEGLASGKGANGGQMVLGGMRSAQGMSGGLGYRRSDLFRDQLGIRGTARGTLQGAYMLDLEVDFQGVRTDRTFLRWYTRFEHSPQIDYFGSGNDSPEANRTSFRYDDFSSDFNASFELVRRLRVGATGGYFRAHTAPSGEDGVPPIDEAFAPETLPGLGEDTNYTRMGLFAYYDSRDSLTGPRSGGLLGARYREYLGRRDRSSSPSGRPSSRSRNSCRISTGAACWRSADPWCCRIPRKAMPCRCTCNRRSAAAMSCEAIVSYRFRDNTGQSERGAPLARVQLPGHGAVR